MTETFQSRDDLATFVKKTVKDQSGSKVEINDGDKIAELGMDSLDVTEALMRVEEKTGVDPDKLNLDINTATVDSLVTAVWTALQERVTTPPAEKASE